VGSTGTAKVVAVAFGVTVKTVNKMGQTLPG